MVFDDGTKTFIRFPRPIGAQGPALFIPQTRTQRATYLNYRIKGDLYVLDRLIDAAELRMTVADSDAGEQEVVRIVRAKAGKKDGRGARLIAHLRGRGDVAMSTDAIMVLTRDD